MIAGPSEVLIIAEGAQNPEWLALDLLAQAEHDADAQSILITPDADLARAVVSRGRAICYPACRALRSPGQAGATTAR